MTEQTTQRPSPEGSVLVHKLNHRVDNEVAAAISVAFLAATRSGNDKLSAMDRHAGFDARDGEHFSNNINVSSESVGQQKAAKVPPRTRILAAAAKLFFRHGIAGVRVEAIGTEFKDRHHGIETTFSEEFATFSEQIQDLRGEQAIMLQRR